MPAIVIKTQDPTIAEAQLGRNAPVTSASAARDVPAGTSWAFRDHRTMKQVMTGERVARCRSPTAPALAAATRGA